jgi:hypothetical protein
MSVTVQGSFCGEQLFELSTGLELGYVGAIARAREGGEELLQQLFSARGHGTLPPTSPLALLSYSVL